MLLAATDPGKFWACCMSDPINLLYRLYFHLVSPIVTEFERVNAFFQATDADPADMVYELSLHYKGLRDRIFDGSGEPLPINKVDLGAKFAHELNLFITRDRDNSMEALAKANEMRQRCTDMLTEAFKQVEKRLPKKSSNLSVVCPQVRF